MVTSDTARLLAAAHRREDPATIKILLAPSADEVRLVEVSSSVESGGEVLPFRFGARPDLGIHHPSVIVLLDEDDWSLLERGRLELPTGWGDAADLVELL